MSKWLLTIFLMLSINISDAAASEVAMDWKASLRSEVQQQFDRELSFWYPGCVDREGFKLIGAMDGAESQKSIVYQSRLTWTAAAVILKNPGKRETLEPIVRHGVEFLSKTMWDSARGGFEWQVNRDAAGHWNGGEIKHLYGQSFAIYSLATAYEATHDEATLTFVKKAFQWLDEHAHDEQHGGYFEAFDGAGKPILSPPRGQAKDFIGTAFGDKSMNAGIHILEMLTAVYRVWPDKIVKARLGEMLEIVRDRFVTDDGIMSLEFEQDWRPLAGPTSWGHNVETSYLIIEADETLNGKASSRTVSRAKSLVDAALKNGWDKEGGFFERGDLSGKVVDSSKEWWTQAEGFNALLMMDQRFGESTDLYRRRAVELWQTIERTCLVGDGAWWFHAGEHRRKNPDEKWTPSVWQANYHTTRAELHALELLENH